ncbi:MAG: AAA family ATPase [Tetrasphaera sp.]|nr:AAA family ATPase [Tetrasphaera sp.]
MGRDAELDRIRRAAGLAASADRSDDAPPGGLVLLSGDAGIGKSRLLAEMAHEAQIAGRLVAIGHCVGLVGFAIAYLPVVELLGQLRDAAPETVADVTHRHPVLHQLLPGTGSAPEQTQLSEPGQIAVAVHACLSELGRTQPVLVVVEDVHWADHWTRDLLTLMLTRGFAAGVTLVVTYRTDDLHRHHPLHALLPVWTRIAHVERLELGRLSGARAEGNPFFAEELASAGERDVRVEDLNRLVLRRMEELGGPGRQIVRAAAVGGRTVSHDLLASVSALAEEEFDSAVADAVEHHILEVTPTGVYTFRHALLAEAVATDLLPGTRRRLHTAYLEVLRSVPGLGGPGGHRASCRRRRRRRGGGCRSRRRRGCRDGGRRSS